MAKIKKSSRVSLAQAVKEATFGWLGTAADLALVALFLGVAGAGIHPGNANRIYSQAGKLFTSLRSKRLQKSLKHSLYHLNDYGWSSGWKITSEGFKRLKHIIPHYIENRPWNGWLYLTIYDIPENLRRSRQNLRKLLQTLTYGMLQESVWVTPHDYVSDLREFLETKGLSTMVFVLEVSDILAGDKDYLVNKIWGVNAIHKRYWDLLVRIENWKRLWVANRGREQQPTDYEVETGGNVDRKLQELADEARDIRLEYLQVILADPMLPRELLPKGWLSDMVKREIRKVLMEPLPKS